MKLKTRKLAGTPIRIQYTLELTEHEAKAVEGYKELRKPADDRLSSIMLYLANVCMVLELTGGAESETGARYIVCGADDCREHVMDGPGVSLPKDWGWRMVDKHPVFFCPAHKPQDELT